LVHICCVYYICLNVEFLFYSTPAKFDVCPT